MAGSAIHIIKTMLLQDRWVATPASALRLAPEGARA
jgi:hypothetical protein